MSLEPNETNPRGTRAELQPTKRKGRGQRLLRIVFWAVWLIDKVFRLISWLSGGPPG